MTSAAARIRDAILRRVLDGPGVSSAAARRAAFDHRDVPQSVRALIDTVTRHAWRVRDADVEAAKAAGASDDEIFELVVSAALGQASRQHAAAMAALDAATALHDASSPQGRRDV